MARLPIHQDADVYVAKLMAAGTLDYICAPGAEIGAWCYSWTLACHARLIDAREHEPRTCALTCGGRGSFDARVVG